MNHHCTTTAAGILAIAALALTGCTADNTIDAKPKPKPSATPLSPQPSFAEIEEAKPGGTPLIIPPEPTGAKRAALLRALAAANPAIVKYEDKAITAARNQCGAFGEGVKKPDWLASQRFTYKDVTTTEAQGKQINEALKGLGFCKA
ncbi:hypothetical protein ACTWJ8_02750 [Streptomyces sp. SDT5-1]|uniref:hypothetical protein n=1 Tax=Streptomyces sp. SDT5-1 TaxID=3406418 RepID=UPI003FD05902